MRHHRTKWLSWRDRSTKDVPAHFINLLTDKLHGPIDVAIKRPSLDFINPGIDLFQCSWFARIKLVFIETLQGFESNIDVAFDNSQLLFVVHDFTLEHFNQLLVLCEAVRLKKRVVRNVLNHDRVASLFIPCVAFFFLGFFHYRLNTTVTIFLLFFTVVKLFMPLEFVSDGGNLIL